ncbi:MAG: hypothetical protein OXG52_10220 [bacterium]|nr:hypothetical protein [bacterium]
MTTQSRVVDLLGQMLARRTDPGCGHVILSEVEYDERLRSLLMSWTATDRVFESRTTEAALRMIRNHLVHGRIETSNSDRILEALIVELEPGLRRPIEAILEDTIRERRLRRDEDVGLSVATSVADSFVEALAADAALLGKLDDEEAVRLGRRAAAQVLAAARWSQVVGDRLDTTQVARLLGVTRQALAKRQHTGSLLGLPGDGTTWYPTWQFDSDEGCIRPEVRDVLGAFRDRLDEFDPLVVAAWATTPQDEDLAGETPAQWLRAGRDQDQLRRAAERAAARLSR